MTTYGLTDEGFTIKPLSVIRAEISATWRDQFGASIDVSDGSPDGQVIGIFAEREAAVWELAQIAYDSQNVDAVTGTEQDQLYALTGCVRHPATHTTVSLVLTGDDAIAIPSGSRASVAVTGDLIETIEDGTTAALDAWVATTAYAVGDRVTASNTTSGITTDGCFVCITAGTSDTDSPEKLYESDPDGFADITDGTAHWAYLGIGDSACDVDAQAVETGAIEAAAFDIRTIETPVGGWRGVTNLEAGATGDDLETDADYRIRREAELVAAGETTPDAIRATLLEIAGVVSATVFYNPTDSTDSDGVPPHAVEALVRGGTTQDIVDTLFTRCIAAGIQAYGNTDGDAVDSEGVTHDCDFSRPSEIRTYVVVHYTYDAATAPTDHEDQVKAAIVAWAGAFRCGRNVTSSGVSAQAFGVDGMLDVTAAYIGIAPAPATSVTIAIGTRELATIALADITIVSTPGTP